MDKILHFVEISAPPEKVYEAVATQAGLASWWSTELRLTSARAAA